MSIKTLNASYPEQINVIIIDDEVHARNIIKSYIKDFPNMNVISECSNGYEGIKAISKYKPELIFLDIQMPKLNGFELLELLDKKPAVIFATAYDEYAVKAFEHNAVDYLLKPFSKERFRNAIENVLQIIKSTETNTQNFDSLAKEATSTKLKRIAVKKGTEIHILPLKSIHYIEAQDDYVMIYSDAGRFLKQKTMKFYEDNLPPNQYTRIHRSYIINIEYVSKIEHYNKETYTIILKSGESLRASKAGYKKLKESLNI